MRLRQQGQKRFIKPNQDLKPIVQQTSEEDKISIRVLMLKSLLNPDYVLGLSVQCRVLRNVSSGINKRRKPTCNQGIACLISLIGFRAKSPPTILASNLFFMRYLLGVLLFLTPDNQTPPLCNLFLDLRLPSSAAENLTVILSLSEGLLTLDSAY